MRIAIDAMGGDQAPGKILEGALDALSLLEGDDQRPFERAACAQKGSPFLLVNLRPCGVGRTIMSTSE